MSSSPTLHKDGSKVAERRSCSRAPLKWVVLVFFGQDNWGKLINLSESGMSFEFAQPPALRQAISFTFEAMGCMPLPHGGKVFSDSFQAAGRVIWTREFERTSGVQFLDLDEKGREQIRNWISSETPQGAVILSSELSISEAAQDISPPSVSYAVSAPCVEAPDELARETSDLDLEPADFGRESRTEPEHAFAPQVLEPPVFVTSGLPHEEEQQSLEKTSSLNSRWNKIGIIVVLGGFAVLGLVAGARRIAPKLTPASEVAASVPNPTQDQKKSNQTENQIVAENPRPFLVEVLDAESRRWLLWFHDDAHPNVSGSVANRSPLPPTPRGSKEATGQKKPATPASRKSVHDFRLVPPNVSLSGTNAPAIDSPPPAAPAMLGEAPAPLETPLGNIVTSRAVSAPVERTLPVGGEVQPARLIRATPPVYPDLAKGSRIAGDVTMDALIDAAGNVRDVRVISGPALLQEAAKQALLQWKYEPARLDGQPTAMHLTVTVKFHIN